MISIGSSHGALFSRRRISNSHTDRITIEGARRLCIDNRTGGANRALNNPIGEGAVPHVHVSFTAFDSAGQKWQGIEPCT
jgi:hypothetical protein